jgi:hypothetical protein
VLEGQGALEILPAVEAAAKNEMAFQQGAGFTKNLKGFGVRHNESQPRWLLIRQSQYGQAS